MVLLVVGLAFAGAVMARPGPAPTRAQSGTAIVVPGLAADSAVSAVPEAAAWVDFLAVYTLEATGAGNVTSSVGGRAAIYSGEFRQTVGNVVPGTPTISLLDCSGPYTTLSTRPLETFRLLFPADPRDVGTMAVILEPPRFSFRMEVTCPDLPQPVPLVQDTFAYWFAIHGGEINGDGGYTLTGFTAPASPGCILARMHKKTVQAADNGTVEEDLSIMVVDRADCPVVHDIDVD
jgi:hypothetical protein